MEYQDKIKLDEIRHEMIRCGIRTNKELAHRCGVSIGTVSNLFRGKMPTYQTIKAIAAGLEMTSDRAGYIFFNQ